MEILIPLGKYDYLPDTDYSSTFPLDQESPWPKFRANELGNGRSSVIPILKNGSAPWSFQTGKGIFSSPVIDGDETIYVGSADHYFYALNKNGSLKWKFQTDEIIDSSALLDNQGRVIFGSGDSYIYCLDRSNGELIWNFKAHTVEEAEEEFGLELYNVNWFEGNIGMLEDGTLLAPNDNQILYALDRETGEQKDIFLGNEMIWSLPAVNPNTNRLFFGTTNFAVKTVFSYDYETGAKKWVRGGLGSVAASPLLTNTKENGAVIVGGFDGYVRAFTQRNGKQLWKVGLNDHIYSSPAQLSDGIIIQPAADGTVYAIDPVKREILWKYDTLEAIRSSPAVDGNDVIYVGSGEGKLFAINPDGTLRWAYQLIDDDRNDLNSSPALGREGICIAGESGEIFYVPYDYPLSSNGLTDPKSIQGPGEALPENGVFLIYTTPFGGLLQTPPETISANQPLTFSLFVREKGDTIMSAIEPESISITVSNNPEIIVHHAANGRFLTLIPQEEWIDSVGGVIDVVITGTYKTDMKRIGLKFFGGKTAAALDSSFSFYVTPRINQISPFQAPNNHGGNSTIFELSRYAAPNPTMLPSYNQIGFDSLHYIAGIVEQQTDEYLVWVVGGKFQNNSTVVDPSLRERYPLKLTYANGLVNFYNYDGFKINFIGSWDMPFEFYRIAGEINGSQNKFINPAALSVVTNADEIKFYGTGLKLMGMSDFKTGEMTVCGGLNINYWNESFSGFSETGGTISISSSENGIQANFENSGFKQDSHVYSILLVDSDGNALPLYYSANTQITSDDQGNLTQISLDFDKKADVSGELKAYIMVDTYPIFTESITIS